MDIDLVNAAVGFKQAQLTSNVQIAVAKKILDNDRDNGAAALKLLDAASKGFEKGDALVAAATGVGGEVDTYA